MFFNVTHKLHESCRSSGSQPTQNLAASATAATAEKHDKVPVAFFISFLCDLLSGRLYMLAQINLQLYAIHAVERAERPC